jgi:hypothetical protein
MNINQAVRAGGDAFPNTGPMVDMDGMCCITVRDYFAAKAMQGIVHCTPDPEKVNPTPGETIAEWISRQAYVVADAMMREREKS